MSSGRIQKLKLNTITSLALQITTVVCGFILPRLILGTFGSGVNGLVNSIAQFLGVISLLDLGVGTVVQSSLYEPLAKNNYDEISKVCVSANRFFKRLALIFLIYVAILMVVYPFASHNKFGYLYNISLIGAMCISSFAQYYFGIVNALLLTADQKGYVQYSVNIITLIFNTIACAILIKMGGSIQIVKVSTSLIFLIRPLFLNLYVKRNYKVDYSIKYKEEPIKQKWNGMAQHFCGFILAGTDTIVLTVFSTLTNVSIYSVYNTVILGVKNALLSMTNGFSALIGNMLVKKEEEKLLSFFAYVEWALHTGTTLLFGCTAILLVPFVKVYTNGVNDADYIQPLFAILLTIANAGHCLRFPYNILILAAGHYKQTQKNYYISMILNIAISIATVKIFGLIGVVIGTLVAMIYQTVWMAWYDSKNIICWPFKNFLKQCTVDIITVVIASVATIWVPLKDVSYISWFFMAVEVFLIWLFTSLFINILFYRKNVYSLFKKVLKKKKVD